MEIIKSPRGNYQEKTLIIGLGHRAQQGKDTAAEHIIKTFGPREEGQWGKYFPLDIRRYAFADPLKEEVFDWIQATAFLFEHSEIFEQDVHEPVGGFYTNINYSTKEKLAWIEAHKPQVRRALQIWGTEFRRKQDPDYWVKKTLKRIKEEAPQVALITDMRFPNEVAVVDVPLKVSRPGFDSGVPLHSSETELNDYPFEYILEATSLQELKDGAETIFVEILEDKGLLPRK